MCNFKIKKNKKTITKYILLIDYIKTIDKILLNQIFYANKI